MSDNLISEILPHATYNPYDKAYTLVLDVKMEDELSLRVGGNVGSNGANQMYIGATYYNLNNYSKEVSVDGQLGTTFRCQEDLTCLPRYRHPAGSSPRCRSSIT